jgi:hypothetical protein
LLGTLAAGGLGEAAEIVAIVALIPIVIGVVVWGWRDVEETYLKQLERLRRLTHEIAREGPGSGVSADDERRWHQRLDEVIRRLDDALARKQVPALALIEQLISTVANPKRRAEFGDQLRSVWTSMDEHRKRTPAVEPERGPEVTGTT